MDDFNTSSQQILALPLSEKERNHKSRTRQAYHVFLSAYFNKFSTLSNEEKKELLVDLQIWAPDVNEANEEDSVMTPVSPAVYEVMKAAARMWEGTSAELKQAWKNRTERLNDRAPNDGSFEEVPDELFEPSLEDTVTESLTKEWRHVSSMIMHSVNLNIKKFMGDSYAQYRFGNETVVLYTQAYKSFYLSHLLKLTIFGSPLYSKLLPHELIIKTRKQALVFFYSHRRISDLFSFGGLNATIFFKDSLKYVCCAKVNLRHDGKNIVGYVMDEENNNLKIKVEGEEEYISLQRPQYDAANGLFMYDNTDGNQSQNYTISQLWPIRMKLNDSGQSHYIISAHAYGYEYEPEYIQ